MTDDGGDAGVDASGEAPSGAGPSADERQPAEAQARERQTVTLGSEGYQPDADDSGTTAGLENAVPDADDTFDWRGWLLVAIIAVAFLVVPGLVLLRPLRIIGFQTTYLLLPLLPAVILGATAVWVAVRSRQE